MLSSSDLKANEVDKRPHFNKSFVPSLFLLFLGMGVPSALTEAFLRLAVGFLAVVGVVTPQAAATAPADTVSRPAGPTPWKEGITKVGGGDAKAEIKKSRMSS